MPTQASPFELLVLPHLDAATNLARWLIRDQAAAEDVVQEAMLRALRFHGGLRGDARPWLLQIVRNVAFAALAAGKRTQAVSLDDETACVPPPVDSSDDPEAALSARQDRRRLERALAALPDELRECLVLRELEEMSYKEIAQVTGVPIGTVMSRLWRARRELLGSAS